MSVFDHIRAEAADFSVKRMCALLGVSRSGYYDHLARQGQPTPPDDKRLVTKMRAFQSAANGTYGTRRLHRELIADERVSRSRVRRLMREHGIVAVQTLLFRKTTDSNHTLGFAPNLLQQNFSTKSVDRVWVGDITFLWTGEGWCYLAVLLDLFSRRVVGWALDEHMRADLPLRAQPRSAVTQSSTGPHPSQRPGQPVRRRQLPTTARQLGRRSEHERRRQLLRQRGG